MSDNRFSCGGSPSRDTFGIETGRILDACRDRDCFEDQRVFLTGIGDDMLLRNGNVRVKSAEIIGANIAVDPVQFNRGFYTVLIRFYVRCNCEACLPIGQTQEFDGIAVLEKRVVLFGGESNVNIFRSQGNGNFCALPEPITGQRNLPEAVVEVVDPIVLGARVVERRRDCRCCCCCCDLPTSVTERLGGTLVDADDDDTGRRYLAISLGLFSVIRLVREGQLLVQGVEYSIPDKECTPPGEEDPCSTFRQIPFPVSEFSAGAVPPAGPSPRGGKCCSGNS